MEVTIMFVSCLHVLPHNDAVERRRMTSEPALGHDAVIDV